MVKKVFLGLSVVILVIAGLFLWGSNNGSDPELYTEIREFQVPPEVAKSDTFSILTYNIGFLSGMTNNLAVETDESFYRDNLNRAIEVISRKDPDIIGFQEIDFGSDRSFHQNQFDSIALRSGYPYGGAAINWDENYVPFPYWPPSVQYGRILSGQGVLSEYPIEENSRIVLDKPEDNPAYYNAFYIDRLIQITRINIEGHDLIVMNVHLEAYKDETRKEQGKVLLEVFREYNKEYPVLLVGDFNAEPEFYKDQFNNNDIMIQFNTEEGLNPAITDDEYYGDPDAYYTFSSDDPTRKIDYIFYNDSLERVESEVIQEAGEISDHLPLFMSFTFKNASQIK